MCRCSVRHHYFCLRAVLQKLLWMSECVCLIVWVCVLSRLPLTSYESRKPNQDICLVTAGWFNVVRFFFLHMSLHLLRKWCAAVTYKPQSGSRIEREYTLNLDMLVVLSSWSSAALLWQGVPLLANTNTHGDLKTMQSSWLRSCMLLFMSECVCFLCVFVAEKWWCDSAS